MIFLEISQKQKINIFKQHKRIYKFQNMIFLSTINSLKKYGYETVESLQSKHPC